MDIKILTKEQINQEIKNRIAMLLRRKPDAILGLATGSSPVGVYEELVKANQNGEIDFSNVTTYNLDEYLGLEPSHMQSYRYFMNEHLFDKINILKSNTHIPSTDPNSDDYYEKYDNKIKDHGGIDFQILGIGSNGHIAFNEPGTDFDSLTHIVTLKESTIKDNSRFFNDISKVPTKAVTMGLKSIMNAKEIVIIVTGKNKAEAYKRLINKETTTDFPASILHRHPKVTVYADNDAASLTTEKEKKSFFAKLFARKK